MYERGDFGAHQLNHRAIGREVCAAGVHTTSCRRTLGLTSGAYFRRPSSTSREIAESGRAVYPGPDSTRVTNMRRESASSRTASLTRALAAADTSLTRRSPDVLAGYVELPDQAGHALHELVSGGRELHPAPMALEQRNGNLGLKELHLPAQGRLRDSQPVGCLAQRPELCNPDEGLQLLQVHGSIDIPSRYILLMSILLR